MEKVKKFIIKEGVTLDHVGLGAAMIIVGGVLFAYKLEVVGLLLLVIGMFVAASVKGYIIDKQNKRVRPYISILFIKLGFWGSIENYNELIYTSSKGRNVPTLSNWRNHSNSSHKSYYLILNQGDKEIILKEFMDYRKGRGLAKEVSRYLEVDLVDEILIAQEVSLKRRKI